MRQVDICYWATYLIITPSAPDSMTQVDICYWATYLIITPTQMLSIRPKYEFLGDKLTYFAVFAVFISLFHVSSATIIGRYQHVRGCGVYIEFEH